MKARCVAAIDLAHEAGKRAKAAAAIAQRRSILFRDLTPVRALEQLLIEEIERTDPSGSLGFRDALSREKRNCF